MALQSDLVRVALTGAVYSAPAGTTAPTNATTAWAAGFVELGYISEDGVTESYNDSTTTIKAWQGGATVRTMITSSEAKFAFTCLETNGEVLARYHKGATIAGTGGPPATGSSIEVVAAQPDIREWGIDVLDGTNHIRIYLPSAEVTERGEITYKNDEPVSYPLTLTAYPDDAGIVAFKFSDDVDWAP